MCGSCALWRKGGVGVVVYVSLHRLCCACLALVLRHRRKYRMPRLDVAAATATSSSHPLPLRIPPPQSPHLHGNHSVQDPVVPPILWNCAEGALCMLAWMPGFLSLALWWSPCQRRRCGALCHKISAKLREEDRNGDLGGGGGG
jgi:hypothetical protein